MERKILSQRINKILEDLIKLQNTLYAMDSTDIEQYPDNYALLSTDAALRSELITCRIRHLIYGTTNVKKNEYLTSAGIVQGIRISEENGTLNISLPCLLPKRKQRKNSEFITDPLYFTLSQYADSHPLPKFSHCVVCFSHIYNRDFPISHIRDYRTRRMLTGTLGGLEQTDNGKTIAVVEYKGYRVVIPLKEMVLNYQNHLTGDAYNEMIVRQHKLLSRMLGAEIDFVIKGIDSKTRSVVASRKEAMLKKRKIFYMDTDLSGEYRIYDGRIVQARVIATSEKAIRIEAFGVEASVMARDLSWEWIGDARDHYAVGDQVLVRVQSVNREDIEHISIKADLRSVSDNRQDNLRLCRIQSKYAGIVTDVHKGVVYIRLTNGVNAIAHSCYDRRRPGKKDDVSFVVTGIDQERGVALGIVTRIIRQNL